MKNATFHEFFLMQIFFIVSKKILYAKKWKIFKVFYYVKNANYATCKTIQRSKTAFIPSSMCWFSTMPIGKQLFQTTPINEKSSEFRIKQ